MVETINQQIHFHLSFSWSIMYLVLGILFKNMKGIEKGRKKKVKLSTRITADSLYSFYLSVKLLWYCIYMECNISSKLNLISVWLLITIFQNFEFSIFALLFRLFIFFLWYNDCFTIFPKWSYFNFLNIYSIAVIKSSMFHYYENKLFRNKTSCVLKYFCSSKCARHQLAVKNEVFINIIRIIITSVSVIKHFFS